MKKFLMTFAAMLLVSAGAFAQSSETPLKGDVNEDGVVDVADINAIITIIKNNAQQETTYYFSIGTTPVTAENYTTANNATTTIPTTIEYTSSQRTAHYILIPSNKTLSIVDKNIGAPIPVTEQTSAGISGHKLYKTNGAIASGATVVVTLKGEKTYYWYVGQSNPVEMTTIDPIVTDETSAGWRLIGTSLPTYNSSNKLYDSNGTIITTGTSLATQWVAIPNESSACVRDGAGNDGTTVSICTRKDNKILNGVEYKVYEWNSKAKKLGYDIY